MDFENGRFSKKDVIMFSCAIIAIIVIIVILLIPENKVENKPTNNKVTIRLLGANPYYLLKDTPYEEPGYEAYDGNGNNISYKITQSSNVDYRIPGDYEIKYKVDTVEVTRKVVVSNITPIFLDEEEYVNDIYTIMMLVKGVDYEKTILPNGNEIRANGIEYEVTENGTYEFTIYDKHGNHLKVEKKVKSIDKEGPKGECKNILDLGKTNVEVTAIDEASGISNYIYDNGSKQITLKEAKYEYSGLYKDINVTIVDKVGNKTTIKCVSSGEGALPPINFPSGTKYTADSDTIKVAIESKSDYYLTHVWVLDPYNQINKGMNDWGKNLLKPYNIINNEISKYGYQDKIIVGINGSGFYSLGSWEPSCSNSCKREYNKTTEGSLVISNGILLRNWYQDSYVDKSRNHATYAISKDGNLEVYYNYNKLAESERKKLFDEIINKEYRNTWTFRPVIMMNGNVVESSILGTFLNGKAKRNVLCQIDRNNFVLFTSTGSHSINELKKVLTNAKCQTAVNLDGGGSTALLFKNKNENLQTISGGGRPIVDTLYFVEK